MNLVLDLSARFVVSSIEWFLNFQTLKKNFKYSGDACPGLDLHFWRKVCRNCKCRKEQHDCIDDDVTGWAQFEILGQVRSKPAYIKISALTDTPVKLDWIPPNIAPDLASDYMNKLGSDNIPVTGSEAASKRKRQLDYQVPAHDLDASLCHNLSEVEAEQLQQYVDKLKNSCVGQGTVIRVESLNYAKGQTVCPAQNAANLIKHDRILAHIFYSEPVNKIYNSNNIPVNPNDTDKILDIPMAADFMESPNLADKSKYKLKQMQINSDAIQSAVENVDFYDDIFKNLHARKIDFNEQPHLRAINDFRREYLTNPTFHNDVKNFVEEMQDLEKEKIQSQYSTPLKSSNMGNKDFFSPLPVKNLRPHKIGILQQQDTPMRKINFQQNVKSNIQDIFDVEGKPIMSTIAKDKILSNVLHSDVVQGILYTPNAIIQGSKLQIFNVPLVPDFLTNPNLNDTVKEKMIDLQLNSQAVQSAVTHGPIYDKIFADLDSNRLSYTQDTILSPIKHFRDECSNNEMLRNEANDFVASLGDEFLDTIPLNYVSPEAFPIGKINSSKSNDSGFSGSIPPTPNYSTYPGLPMNSANNDVDHTIHGIPGTFRSIPGIEDMNMYPEVSASQNYKNPFVGGEFEQNFAQQMNISHSVPQHAQINCKECKEDIKFGEVAVKAERAGKEDAWHPQCFKCNKCNELLADLVYFYHNNHVYCARDLAEILKIPRCKACDELIFTKEYTAAEGATFHIKHFCCYNCDEQLAGKQYLPDDKTNMPLCLDCYDSYFAKKCHRCANIIGPTDQGTILN